MLKINLVEPKAAPISPFCQGMYILPLWKQAKTHFMTLILKKDDRSSYKLSLVLVDYKDN